MTRRHVCDAAVAIGCVLLVAGLVIDVVTIAGGGWSSDALADLALTPALVTLALLAPAIARRRPENPIGPLFAGLFLNAGVVVLVDSWAIPVADPSYGPRPYDDVAAWLANFVWAPIMVTLLCELPLRFPDGMLPGARWRWAERLFALQIAVLVIGLAFAPGKMDNYPLAENPFGVERGGALFTWLAGVGYLLLTVCVALGAFAIVFRFRRARGVERQQLKWLSLGAVAAAACFGVSVVFTFGFEVDLWSVSVPIAIWSVLSAAGLAVMRYRLYDIDRLISRTLSWVALTVLLAAGYVGLVLAGQALFSSVAGGSNLAIAVSTLIVAALFLPLRSRVQQAVDRRFYRRRYDAQRTLDSFGARVREQVELDALRSELCGAVETTMQPAHVSLWLRPGETP